MTAPHSSLPTDDIARLRSLTGLPHLRYLDIALQAELQEALQRWPLLAELARQPCAEPSPESPAT